MKHRRRVGRAAVAASRVAGLVCAVALLIVVGATFAQTPPSRTLAVGAVAVPTEPAPTVVATAPVAAPTPTTPPVRPTYRTSTATMAPTAPTISAAATATLAAVAQPTPTSTPAPPTVPASTPTEAPSQPTAPAIPPTVAPVVAAVAPTPEPTAMPPAPPTATAPPPIAGCSTGRAPLVAFAQRASAATPSPAVVATTRPGPPPTRASGAGGPATPTATAPTPAPTPTAMPTPPPPPTLEQEVRALLAQYAPGTLDAGLVIAIAGGDAPVRINADQPFATASLYKLFVLWRLQVELANGNLAAEQHLVYCPEDDDSAEDGGQLGAYGDTFTVAELRRLMIVRSNNTATWMLAHRLGWGEIDRMVATAGFTHTSASEGQSTPDEIARFYRGLFAQNLDPRLTARDYASLIALLQAQEINHLLPAGLPPGTPFAHKTGNLVGVLNDAGVITLPDGRTILIVALTRGDEGASQELLRALAALVWRHATR